MGKATKGHKNRAVKAKFTRQQKAWFVVGLILFLIAGGWGYNQYLDWADYNKFQAVKKSVDTLAKRFEEVDKTVTWHRVNHCSYASVKFRGDIDPSCHITIEANYQAVSIDQVKRSLGQYEKILLTSNDLLTITSTDKPFLPNLTKGIDVNTRSFNILDNKHTDGQLYYVENKTGVSCGVHTAIINAPESPEVNIQLNCSQQARNEYFPELEISDY